MGNFDNKRRPRSKRWIWIARRKAKEERKVANKQRKANARLSPRKKRKIRYTNKLVNNSSFQTPRTSTLTSDPDNEVYETRGIVTSKIIPIPVQQAMHDSLQSPLYRECDVAQLAYWDSTVVPSCSPDGASSGISSKDHIDQRIEISVPLRNCQNSDVNHLRNSIKNNWESVRDLDENSVTRVITRDTGIRAITNCPKVRLLDKHSSDSDEGNVEVNTNLTDFTEFSNTVAGQISSQHLAIATVSEIRPFRKSHNIIGDELIGSTIPRVDIVPEVQANSIINFNSCESGVVETNQRRTRSIIDYDDFRLFRELHDLDEDESVESKANEILAKGKKSNTNGATVTGKLCKRNGSCNSSDLRVYEDRNSSDEEIFIHSSHKSPENIHTPSVRILSKQQKSEPSSKCTQRVSTVDEKLTMGNTSPTSSECGEVVNIEGRRIVDVSFLFQQLHDEIEKHSKVCRYSAANFGLENFRDRGLRTQMFFCCRICDYYFTIWSDNSSSNVMGVNEAAVCGIITAGTGYSALEEMLAAIGVPAMSHVSYRDTRATMYKHFRAVAIEEMKQAAAKEREIAIKKGKVINGMPYIRVVVDGSWAKRSYTDGKHDSLSGCATIYGAETNLALYIDVRNKYCATCEKAKQLHRDPREHDCYKNWGRDQSSNAMETDIIVKGFMTSIETHDLIYRTVISDGDASTYQAIRNANPYSAYGVLVKKYECSNHLFRNLCRKCREASKKKLKATPTKGFVSVTTLRACVHSSGFKMRKLIIEMRDIRKEEDVPKGDKCIRLQKDILNILNHVFGDHAECHSLPILCDPEAKDKNLVPELIKTGLHEPLSDAIRYLSCHAYSLLKNVTNNIAESGNSIINKLNSGKRLNHCATNSCQMRTYGAVVQHNSQEALSKVYIHTKSDVPPAIEKMERDRKLNVLRTKIARAVGTSKRIHRKWIGTDKDYGPSAEKPDVSKTVYDVLVEKHFDKLKKYQDDRIRIERETIAQSDSELWHQIRTEIITASHFGPICRMQRSTSCSNMVKSVRYPKIINTPATQYGIDNEPVAREALQLELGKNITSCGLFIDPEISYIGASPDGLIGTDGIVEIKRPFSAKDAVLDEALARNTTLKSILDRKNRNLMNKNHKYFYQVQGQLHVTRRKYCIFAMWTSVDLKSITVLKDDGFWRDKMEPFLTRFYTECLLPEIVDSRFKRSMPIKDPEYILQAQEGVRYRKAQPLSNKRKCDQGIQTVHEKKKTIFHQENSNSSDIDDPSQDLAESIKVTRNAGRCEKPVPNLNWVAIEIDDDMEVSEAGRQVLESLKRNISVAEVIADITSETSLLNDTSIDFFQTIVEENTDFHCNPASYSAYYQYIQPCTSGQDLQIIGGNESRHWCCIHYDAPSLLIYDSMLPVEYHRLSGEVKRYIQRRYPNVSMDDIILQPVTKQPDPYSCGVYAAAFATTVALGGDPIQQKYSRSSSQMRAHLISIVQSQALSAFPTE